MRILKLLIIGALLLLSVNICYPQNVNIVPNNSFEEIKGCPIAYSQINLLYNWFKPVLGSSPDYFNSCWDGIPQNIASVPYNLVGFQNAYIDSGYIGLCLDLIYIQYISKNYREYVSVRLTEELKPCFSYRFAMHVNLADSSNFKTEYISALFTRDSIWLYLNDSMFLYQPQLNFKILEADTQNWYKVEGVYLAQGGEKYLTIGNFLDSNAIKSQRVKNTGNFDYAYYYIDDVSLTELPDQELSIPNIITPNSDGLNDAFVINNLPAWHSLWVYNRWGNQVYYSSNYQNDWSPPDLADGVYFYILQPPCGERYKGTVTVLGVK